MSIVAHALYSVLGTLGILIGHVGIAGKLVPRQPIINRMAGWLAHLWAVLVLLLWIARVRSTSHLPLFGTYESALSLALATMLAAILWEHIGRRQVSLSPLAVLSSGALLVHGRGFDPTPYALTISEQSWVVDVHAVVAWTAFGVLTVNSILALRIILTRGEEKAQLGRWLIGSLRIGFLLHTGLLVSGSVYKFLLFGTAWSFDPIETMAIVVWMAYGALLHLHAFAGWNTERLARWCFGVFLLLVVSFRCIVYFPPWSTYHIFDMDRRLHVSADDLSSGGGG